MSALMSISAYARAIDVAPSTISRAVKAGKIPVVKLADGTVRIDRADADSARRLNSAIQSGHGGKPDRAQRRQSKWVAQSESGYVPAVRAILNVMRSEWPGLMRDCMKVLGASELDQARGVLAMTELSDYLACFVFSDRNRAGVFDYRTVLEPLEEITFSDPEVQAFFQRWGEDGGGSRWASEEVNGGMPGAEDLIERIADASAKAKP